MIEIPIGSRWVEMSTGWTIVITGHGPDSPWWKYEASGCVWYCCATDFTVWKRFRRLPDVLTEAV